MSDVKFQVFISSTFTDLSREREIALETVLNLGHIPSGMELFPAADEKQLDYIKRVIDQCDYYLLIIGGRYGSVDADGVSYTEREFDYAVSKGKHVVAFVHKNPSSLAMARNDTEAGLVAKLEKFKEKVRDGRLIEFWSEEQDLNLKMYKSLSHAFSHSPQIGWVRGDHVVDPAIVNENHALRNEVEQLKAALTGVKRTQVEMKYEDLANMSDKFRLVGDFNDNWGNELAVVSEVAWQDIFLAVAGRLDPGGHKSDVRTALEVILGDGCSPHHVSVSFDDLARVIIQLKALGLIEGTLSKSRTGDTIEYLSLTERGREKYVSTMVVRRDLVENTK